MAQLNIPVPCNEDWSKMTPTEKGAFCGKCQIDVKDFTSMSNEDIKDFFIANRGKKTCGHIRKSQLSSFNINYASWENQSQKTFMSKFLWACLIAFGMTLFIGCENTDEGYEVMGEMEFVHPDSTATCGTEVDTTASCDGSKDIDIMGDIMIDGEVEYLEDDSTGF
ncbi:MAG: hypothetical protein ACPG21_08440 [Crocinitomicaceae bacterium]